MDQSASSNASRASWHTQTAEQALSALAGDADRGLALDECQRRLADYGPNRLQEIDRVRWYTVLARQFLDVLIGILIIAAGVAFAIGEHTDGFTILAIVLLNGLLGFIQEWRAEQALEALKQMLTPRCKVIREGSEREIDADNLVPGDLVVLEIGDHVPADLRLVGAIDLRADESSLTGESVSVRKQLEAVPEDTELAGRSCMVWAGTAITNGRAKGVAVATGMATQFGRIADLTQRIDRQATPLQRKLARLGRQLGVISVGLAVLVALSGWLLGRALAEVFFIGVALAVAIVPEGLPAVVTIALALGVSAMVRRRALLRRLQAAETLGETTVICTDKTGTLTQNEMTVTRIWLPSGDVQVTGVGYDPAGHFEDAQGRVDYRRRADLLALLQTALCCNNAYLRREAGAWQPHGEPTEAALVVAAYKAWQHPDDHPRVAEFSFDSTRKRMSVVTRRKGSLQVEVKGAPEVILDRCTRILVDDAERALSESDRQAFNRAYAEMAEQGLRTLAMARRALPDPVHLNEDEVERDLTLLGVVGIIDPPRPEVPAAIETARQAGIEVRMITGDAAPTAAAIARQVGLPVEKTVVGSELKSMDDTELSAALREQVVFARTTPEHKLRIVNLLKRDDQVVAMTGDGVNDAPALKQADVGIAMGVRGTDVARGASDVILTDDNFASIVGAVEEGRRQYDNIKKFIRYLMSSNSGEVLAIFFNILTNAPLILLPVHILWMNLVTDSVIALSLGVEPAEQGVMKRKPRPQSEAILDRPSLLIILGVGTYIGLLTLGLFHYCFDVAGYGLSHAQTVAFTGIIVMENITVFGFRTFHDPVLRVGLLSNPWTLLAWITTLVIQLCAVYTPLMQQALHTVALGWSDWALILAVALPLVLGFELIKWIRTARGLEQEP